MPIRSALLVFLKIALLTLVFQNCKNAEKPPTGKDAEQVGHRRMIALLDSIEKNADPQLCYNLNSRAAEKLLAELSSAAPEQQMNIQFNYAVQLLKAGKNEDAIMQFSEMIRKMGGQMNDRTKILHELLAMSYMRLGEQQNCINTHNPESCVIPLQGGGVYKLRSGPGNAIRIYEQILAVYPKDAQTIWLYNIANQALGYWPDKVPPQFRLPAAYFQKKGDIQFREVGQALGLDVSGTSGGICIEDFDGDGNLDVFTTAYELYEQARFFHNNGDGTFTDRTAAANLTGIKGGLNAIHADYDNDGDRDILVLRGAWLIGGTHPNSLLRNNGDGTFTDVTIAAGLLSFHPTQAADWADYDGDGWLDLFIGNETFQGNPPHPCEFYHNNGDGTFTNVAPKLGLDFVGFFKAAVWGDVNNDQRPDLYLSDLLANNRLLINRGGASFDTWKFEDIAPLTGTGFPTNSFPAFFFDFNNDGLDDILCSFFAQTPEDPSVTTFVEEVLGKQPDGDWMRVYQNLGNEKFADVTQKLGLKTITYAMGNNFGDLDNDGWTDIFLGTGRPDLRALIPNRVFHNLGGKRFEDISMNGFSHIQKGHGVAFGDLDNDGDQEIYVVAGGAFEGDISFNLLYENPGNGNRWLTVMLEGTTCNRDARGAKIRVTVADKNGSKRQVTATVGTGGSFGSSSLRQEMGLGQAVKIEKLEIQWPKPGVAPTVLTDVPMDKIVKITEGKAGFEISNLKKISLKT